MALSLIHISAGAGSTVGGKIGPAGFRFGVFGVRIAGVQLFQLAAARIQMVRYFSRQTVFTPILEKTVFIRVSPDRPMYSNRIHNI